MKDKFSQKKEFLNGEGDSWHKRNLINCEKDYDNWAKLDPLLPFLLEIPCEENLNTKVIEIGMGQGLRLNELKKIKSWKTFGIDPSQKAVEFAKLKGIDAQVGTADKIPLGDKTIDILIYGFCLYLCDMDDLFVISSEANRVLKDDAWVAILDFWSPHFSSNEYHHAPSLKSFKIDRTKMFTWHPFFKLYNHKILSHIDNKYIDDKNEWISISLIRKKTNFRIN